MRARELKKLQAAAQMLEDAAADVFAACWYFERKSSKGKQWSWTGLMKTRRALIMLRPFFMQKDLDHAEDLEPLSKKRP